jgi:hypothetical protein
MMFYRICPHDNHTCAERRCRADPTSDVCSLAEQEASKPKPDVAKTVQEHIDDGVTVT